MNIMNYLYTILIDIKIGQWLASLLYRKKNVVQILDFAKISLLRVKHAPAPCSKHSLPLLQEVNC
jgi:hypothetical protein